MLVEDAGSAPALSRSEDIAELLDQCTAEEVSGILEEIEDATTRAAAARAAAHINFFAELEEVAALTAGARAAARNTAIAAAAQGLAESTQLNSSRAPVRPSHARAAAGPRRYLVQAGAAHCHHLDSLEIPLALPEPHEPALTPGRTPARALALAANDAQNLALLTKRKRKRRRRDKPLDATRRPDASRRPAPRFRGGSCRLRSQ